MYHIEPKDGSKVSSLDGEGREGVMPCAALSVAAAPAVGHEVMLELEEGSTHTEHQG